MDKAAKLKQKTRYIATFYQEGQLVSTCIVAWDVRKAIDIIIVHYAPVENIVSIIKED